MKRFAVICCIALIGLVPSAARAQNLGTDAQRADGKRVYEKMCAQCHGYEGDGKGVAAKHFNPTPRDFTFGMFKIRTTPSGELPTDDDLKRVIRDGMPYTGMPAWPQLSDDELTNVVFYLKTFNSLFADPDFAASPIDIPNAPGFSEASAAEGKRFWDENKCADCHGDSGRGNGKSAPTLKNEWGEPIRPADLTRRWTFRGGSRREDIYRTFSTGLNGTPMPSYADLIEPDDRWHLVDYVYSMSRNEPEYATTVVAIGTDKTINVDDGESLFDDSPPAYFPVFGQVIEPDRMFFPSSNGIEVRAVYNNNDIAVMLNWTDMTAETSGSNSPVPPDYDPEVSGGEDAGRYSDAVAVLTPSEDIPGFVKPYFLFGDARNPMDIWFADMAKDHGELFVGRGSGNIETTGQLVATRYWYDDGRWTVILVAGRDGGLSRTPGSFVPVAFSVWDGYNGERGNRRGLTSWYSMYLKPLETESKAGPIAMYGVITLLLELAVIGVVRKRNRSSVPAMSRRVL